MDILHSWGMQSYQLVARLQPGITREQAATEMAGLGKRIRVDHPERARVWQDEPADYRDISPILYPTTRTRFWPGARGSVMSFLGLLATVAFLILLIACFNVANLVLMRTITRRSELGVRLSLGAAPGRLRRQLLTENLMLAAVGGVTALVVGAWVSGFLARFHQAFRVPLDVDAGFDANVLIFAAVVSVAAAAVLTFFPARLASKYDVVSALKADTGSAGFRRMRANQILIAAQVSLSVLLLLGAGLFIRTLREAQAADVTVRSEQVLLSALDLGSRDYDAVRGSALYARILENVRALPGVVDAALVNVVPLAGRRGGTNIWLTPPGGNQPRSVQVGFNVITPAYFRTVGIPLVRGRDISVADHRDAPLVAVINDEMARRMFAGQDPLGRRFGLKGPAGQPVEVEILGVVRDGKFRSYRSEPEPTVYVPLTQHYRLSMNLEVRTTLNPGRLAGAIRAEIATLDKDLPLSRFVTLKTHLAEALSQERLSASLLTGLSILALVLAAIGVYGVLSNSVAQRTRELGIRMALGADTRAVQLGVLADAMRPVILGLVIGLGTAVALTRLIRNLLYGISATDPAVYCTVVLILLATAALAALIPARRAARTDPASVLRYQ
jgi:predicted permease